MGKRQQYRGPGGKTWAFSTKATDAGFELSWAEAADFEGKVSAERVQALPDGEFRVVIGGKHHRGVVTAHRDRVWISVAGQTYAFEALRSSSRGQAAEAEGGLTSPMPGRVVSVSVTEGQAVAKGDVLVTVEAMKMEHAIRAPADGVVGGVHCEAGQQVDIGFTLVTLSPAEEGGGAPEPRAQEAKSD